MRIHSYTLIDRNSFPHQHWEWPDKVCSWLTFRARLLLLPGDPAVSWPCRWHRAPDDHSLLYEPQSVIAVLTMQRVGFAVGDEAREVQLCFAKISLKKRQVL